MDEKKSLGEQACDVKVFRKTCYERKDKRMLYEEVLRKMLCIDKAWMESVRERVWKKEDGSRQG